MDADLSPLCGDGVEGVKKADGCGNFAYGEYPYALPLASELDALCGVDANLSPLRGDGVEGVKKPTPVGISPAANILTPCRLQASLTRSAAWMRTQFRYAEMGSQGCQKSRQLVLSAFFGTRNGNRTHN